MYHIIKRNIQSIIKKLNPEMLNIEFYIMLYGGEHNQMDMQSLKKTIHPFDIDKRLLFVCFWLVLFVC